MTVEKLREYLLSFGDKDPVMLVNRFGFLVLLNNVSAIKVCAYDDSLEKSTGFCVDGNQPALDGSIDAVILDP